MGSFFLIMSKLLTPLELKVMNLLWEKKEAFVKDLVEDWCQDPKPAYNTISTTVRILEEKGYIGHNAFGRTYQYFPLVKKNAYQKRLINNVIDNAFSGSMSSLVSALVEREQISNEEIEALKALIDQQEKK